MEIQAGTIFNLWDTNGRRKDVLNALDIYVHILHDLSNQYPAEKWGAYPQSLAQFRFYKAAIEASPDVFLGTDKYKEFVQSIAHSKSNFYNKSLSLTAEQRANLDQNIEARARHYTSNLQKFGFATETRQITEAGYCLLQGKVQKDIIESIFPINDINLLLLRQLLKLRIVSVPDKNGIRRFYSPCLLAIHLLLHQNVDRDKFRTIIQSVSPYSPIPMEQLLRINENDFYDTTRINIPKGCKQGKRILFADFEQYIKNRKSSRSVQIYYDFYNRLYDYVKQPSAETYAPLREILQGNDGKKLEKAFGKGNGILQIGTKAIPFSYDKFIEHNSHSPLLQNVRTLNREFYITYFLSKCIDQAYEYSDTTMRMLNATGIFQCNSPLVELLYKGIWQTIWNNLSLQNHIFGTMTKVEYQTYQANYGAALSLCQILHITDEQCAEIVQSVSGAESTESLRQALANSKRTLLEQHIAAKYPQEKVCELLRLFSDRNNDQQIRYSVNPEASVPTIYEYIVAIAWYYIANKKISVYDSINLTLNADFEPIMHAAGGMGDIVVNYADHVVMLEATLMNASAQKRGEWEPVLRHAVNLTVDNASKKVTTLFIADQLDYNTIHIWRAVAAVTLRASNSDGMANHVVIMPIKNEELCAFLQNNITDKQILTAVGDSYDEIRNTFDDQWRNRILQTLSNEY